MLTTSYIDLGKHTPVPKANVCVSDTARSVCLWVLSSCPASLLLPTKDRRERLYSEKRFWCDCSRCIDDDLIRPLACPRCDGQNASLYHSVKREREGEGTHKGWKCSKCLWEGDNGDDGDNGKITREERKKLDEVLDAEKRIALEVVFPVADIINDGVRGYYEAHNFVLFPTSISFPFALVRQLRRV